jgi:hypothetical protein
MAAFAMQTIMPTRWRKTGAGHVINTVTIVVGIVAKNKGEACQ